MPVFSFLNGGSNPLKALHAATIATMATDGIRAIVLKTNTDSAIIQMAINETYNVILFQNCMETDEGNVYSRGIMIMPSIAKIAPVKTVIDAIRLAQNVDSALFAELDSWTFDPSGRTAMSSDAVKSRPSLVSLTDIMRKTVNEWVGRLRKAQRG